MAMAYIVYLRILCSTEVCSQAVLYNYVWPNRVYLPVLDHTTLAWYWLKYMNNHSSYICHVFSGGATTMIKVMFGQRA